MTDRMRNQAANTQTPAHLDYLEVGCVIDGSHSHPDDFSVAIIRYAESLGWEIQDVDLVHVLIREQGLDMPLEYHEKYGEHLVIASDEAVEWLNDKVAADGYVFHVEESDLFLSPRDEDDDDNPLDNLPGVQGYHPF